VCVWKGKADSVCVFKRKVGDSVRECVFKGDSVCGQTECVREGEGDSVCVCVIGKGWKAG
jgi:hypothetical protein